MGRESPDALHGGRRSCPIGFGVDERRVRTGMTQSDPGHIETEFLPEQSRGVVPELARVPLRDLRPPARPGDRPPVRRDRVDLAGCSGSAGLRPAPLGGLNLRLAPLFCSASLSASASAGENKRISRSVRSYSAWLSGTRGDRDRGLCRQG